MMRKLSTYVRFTTSENRLASLALIDLEEVVGLGCYHASANGRAIKFAVTLNVTVAPCCDTDCKCYTNHALAFCIVGN